MSASPDVPLTVRSPTEPLLCADSLPPQILVPPPGPRSRQIAARLSRVDNPSFDDRRQSRAAQSGEDHTPIVYASARGSNVTCADGNRYVDLVMGFGACTFGHAPPWLTSELARVQAELPLALGDVYASEAKALCQEKLAALFPEPGARVILGLSGADAVTAALKTAVLSTGRSGVVAFTGGYHGLSYAPLAACGLAAGFRSPFQAQLGDHVRFAHYPDAEAKDPEAELARALADADALARQVSAGAILVEPILGRGGCIVPPAGFLRGLREICDRYGALLIADEIWSGMGRSGALLASLPETTPDLVCVGKGLGAGVPISACIGRESAMAGWGAHGGSAIHTATHFGSPPACAAATMVIDVLCNSRAWEHAQGLGAALRAALAQAGLTVTGQGLMLGVHMKDAGSALAACRRLLARGYIVLTGGVRGNVLTLTPALNAPASLLLTAAEALAEEAMR
jgi:4-aminobutyrate aminotransferase/(S)-3-amino-2-methylpropionate transaminase